MPSAALMATALSSSDGSQLKNSVEAVHELANGDCDAYESGGDDDERAALDAYARSCDAIVTRSVERYVGFVRRRRRVVDDERWALICEARGLRVYKERVEARSMASVASLVAAEGDAEGGSGRASEEVVELPGGSAASSSSSKLRRQASVVRSPSTMVSAFCVGRLRGSLDSVMAGLYADTADDMRANCTIQFGDELLDCGIVQTFERDDDGGGERQHRYFGVKWLEKQSAFPPGVVDQLCWVERTGVHTIASGRRFGYQLLKSVVPLEEQASTAFGAARPTSISLCYLYCQLDADLVEVFARGIVEVGSSATSAAAGEGEAQEEVAVRAAGEFILAAVRGRECGRMRKIAQLIDQSKSDRAQLTACNCSKVIPGLPKVEMCASCVEAMRQRKLVDVRELTRASRSLAATERSAAQLALLQTRYGSVRHDAEVPAHLLESYRESQSFRMFLPIRDPRPRSSYRAARKQRGNVLMQMLERNHRQGSFLPTFLRPDEADDGDDTAAAAAAAVAAATAATGAAENRVAGAENPSRVRAGPATTSTATTVSS